MGVSKFTGADAMLKNLKKLREQLPDQFAAALYQETEIEATECRRRAPVLHGPLRASIHAEGPHREGRKITTSVVAGGPSAPYALIVHEDLDAIHRNGEAKFIERPLNEATPHLAERVAARIDLNKAGK